MLAPSAEFMKFGPAGLIPAKVKSPAGHDRLDVGRKGVLGRAYALPRGLDYHMPRQASLGLALTADHTHPNRPFGRGH
jgi:hypothetical protein